MNEPDSKAASSTRLVLFDLDGTFADTAPDLAYALNLTLALHGRTPLPLETIRPHVSHGGVALIRLGFKLEPQHPDFSGLRQQFLDYYQSNLTRGTRLFPGIEELIEALDALGIAWGIVTNKPSWLTDPLMQQLQLTARARPHRQQRVRQPCPILPPHRARSWPRPPSAARPDRCRRHDAVRAGCSPARSVRPELR